MGIKDLLPALSSIITPVHLQDLKNLTVAVDAYVWLHKGAYACSSELCQELPTSKYISYCMSWIQLLKSFCIRPILVFDGGSLPSKQATNESRREKRRASKQQATERLESGDVEAADNLFKRAVNITSRMAYNLIEVLQKEGVEFIIAPYEADAQLAFLSLNSVVDAVITEDSDLIVFGCSRIIFKLDRNGSGKQLILSNLANNADMDLKDWTHDKFRQMCIMSGCDYLGGLPGVGLKTAHKYITQFKDLEAILNQIRATKKNVVIPPTYLEDFKRAELTFLHQRVWDPKSRRLVPLNPFPEGLDTTNMDFIGPDLGDEISQQIAEGKLDPFTKEPYMKDADPAQYMRDANIYYMEKQLQKQRIGQRAVLSPGPPQKSNHILNFFKRRPDSGPVNRYLTPNPGYSPKTTSSLSVSPTISRHSSTTVSLNSSLANIPTSPTDDIIEDKEQPNVRLVKDLLSDYTTTSSSQTVQSTSVKKSSTSNSRKTSTKEKKEKKLTSFFSNTTLTPASEFLSQLDSTSEESSQAQRQKRRTPVQSQLSSFFSTSKSTSFYEAFSQSYSAMAVPHTPPPPPRGRGASQSPFIDLTLCDRIIIVEDEDTTEEKDHSHTKDTTMLSTDHSLSEEEEVLWGWQIESMELPLEETPLQRLLSRKRKHRAEGAGYASDQDVSVEPNLFTDHPTHISDSEEEEGAPKKRKIVADDLIVWDTVDAV